jgi:hypothetical protein
MTRVLALIVAVACLSAPVLSAAGPIAASASAIAQRVPQPNDLERQPDDGAPLMWAGVAMLAGGVTLEILAQTALKVTDYAYAYDYSGFSYAYETHANRPLLFTGVALDAGSAVLFEMASRRRHRRAPSLSFSPHGVSLVKSISF